MHNDAFVIEKNVKQICYCSDIIVCLCEKVEAGNYQVKLEAVLPAMLLSSIAPFTTRSSCYRNVKTVYAHIILLHVK